MSGFLRAFAFSLVMLSAPVAGSAATFSGPAGAVVAGGSFTVTGEIGGDDTVGFDLFVTMDSGLSLSEIALPNDEAADGSVITFDPSDFSEITLPGDGSVLVQVSSLLAAGDLPNDAVNKIILTFLTRKGAPSPLSIRFSGERAFFDGNGAAKSDDFFGEVTVSLEYPDGVVPLPATATLLLSGLAVFGAVRARARRAA